jgi:sterol desaturase/sphingolipid hydroxylase (fatty acid hydroxylase superfamily)
MGWFDAAGLVGGIGMLLKGWGEQAARMLLSPGSQNSIAALACVLAIAALFTLSERKRKRPVRVKVLARALFPRRLFRSASGKADLLFAIFNIFIAGMLFGWAIMSSVEVSRLTQSALTSAFGAHGPTTLPEPLCAALMTLALYLAYEFGYWLNHYLSHKVSVLWEFHKVHHSAESLSPLTNFRVHPVDSIVFYNMIAISVGLTAGVMNFNFGRGASGFALGGTNILLLIAGVALTHLQHSHLWISFSGRLGHFILSPAHHQIHHSTDRIHFDKNFGSSLALWDRLFGTLHVPAKKREKLSFGVPELEYDPHSARGGLVMPVIETGRRVKSKLVPSAAPGQAPAKSVA